MDGMVLDRDTASIMPRRKKFLSSILFILSVCFSLLLEDESAIAWGGFGDIIPEAGGDTRDVVVMVGCCSSVPILDVLKNPLVGQRSKIKKVAAIKCGFKDKVIRRFMV